MQEKKGDSYLKYAEKKGLAEMSGLMSVAELDSEEKRNQAVATQKSWAVLKQFSSLRENLVQWLPIEKKDRILEIGSECGALTSFFAECAAEVTCIERSREFCAVNEVRNRNRNNIKIYQGQADQIPELKGERYDWIFLIGVLPKASFYISGAHPEEELLAWAEKHLAPGGKIVLALENRLGLRYWAGYPDEYTDRYFEALESGGISGGIRRFSKKELEKLLSHFESFSLEFYYPYPDYLFPLSVYSDGFLPKKGDLKMNYPNYDRIRAQLFQESMVYEHLIENDVYPEFANSFLVLMEEKQ